VAPTHLDFGYQDYDRHGDEPAVRAALARVVADASEVLLPASPLTHPDHEWVVRVALELPPGRVGFYVEQPYGVRSRGERVPEWLVRELGVEPSFAAAPGGLRDRLAKWRAVRAYASQLPLLALTGRRALSLAWRPERVAWLDRGPH
jgi:LmbE family N-acetylglucosaminyl deacetylase